MKREFRRSGGLGRSAMVAAAAWATLIGPAAISSASGQATGVKAVAAAKGPEIDLKRIILYRSGVGYFERQGLITGSEKVQLKFETDQINDILKTMVLLDLDGGTINAVTYNSKEPLERRLRSFGVDVSGAPSIADLFTQLRGAAVRVTSVDGPVEGTILGVESRPVAGPLVEGRPGPVVNQQFVNLVTSAGVRSLSIPGLSSFQLLDAQLSEELNKALAALAEQRTEHTKAVDLSFSGADGAARRVVVSYVHEMPVWKTSYRLVLPDEAAGKSTDGKGKESTLTLQGWAIVENTTDSDWKDVKLSLASGRPVSFTMDLYEPLFTPRPDVPVPVLAGVLPRVYESAMNRQDFAVAEAEKKELGRRQLAKDLRGGLAAPAAVPANDLATGGVRLREGASDEAYASGFQVSADQMANYAAAAQASAGEAGEQFMYTLDVPVTLERQRSAMLPILSAPVEGRRVSIYNAQAMAKHPMRGVEMKNSSSLHLMPGPISVYDAATYAGDAQIPHTSRGQERLLSYAVDLDVLGTTETTGNQSVIGLKIVDGLIVQTSKLEQTVKYTFTNNDPARGRTLLVEHPKLPGWELKAPEKPTEAAENLYRFEKELEAGKGGELTVRTEQITRQNIAVTGYPLESLLAFAKQGKASQAVVDAVQKAAAMQARINEFEKQLKEMETRRDEIANDQNRIRNNMNSIDRNSDLYRRYSTKLNEQESALEDLLSKRDSTQSSRNQAQKDLNAYLKDLRVE